MGWDASALGARGAHLAGRVESAERAGDHETAARLLLDAADALIGAQESRQALHALDAAAVHAAESRERRLAGEVQWRLGQLNEGLLRHAQAASAYERAADAFAAEGDVVDQVYALQGCARARSRTEGPEVALRTIGEAIDLARRADDDELLADAMELGAELAAALGLVDDAFARYREAGRLRQRLGDSVGFVRAVIGQAECELERGDHVRAINTLAPVETELEIGLDAETEGRGLALLARFHLHAGERTVATEHFEKAQEVFERSGARGRQAALLLAFARQLESGGELGVATRLYEAALQLYQQLRDAGRIGPAAYSLARCYFERNELVRADLTIDEALDTCKRLGDVEGLELCTELGVRIAVRMGQGKLALERLRLAARVKGELGDYPGEVRYLMRALEATLAIPELDSAGLAEEFIEALRRSGTRFLAPGEGEAIAERLAEAERPEFGREIMAVQAQAAVDDGRLVDGARAFAHAATFAARGREWDEAMALWDQAIAIGAPIGLEEVATWRVDRGTFEGR